MKRQVKRMMFLVVLCLMAAVFPVQANATEEWDNDLLFAGYVEQVFSGGSVARPFSLGVRSAGAALTGDEKIVYDRAVPVIKAIAAGQQTVAEVTVEDGLTGSFNGFDGNALIQALMADYPYEMYWYDKTSGWRISGATLSGTLVRITVQFSVAEAYRGTDVYTADAAKTGAATTAAANAAAVVADYANLDDYDKLKAYSDRICSLVS